MVTVSDGYWRGNNEIKGAREMYDTDDLDGIYEGSLDGSRKYWKTSWE
jgi:hypothetical protein